MTTTAAPRTRTSPTLLGFTAAMAALAVVCLAGLVADDRIITGAPAWLKPFKFSVSLAVYAGTLAWLLTLLPERSRRVERAVVVIVAAGALEMVAIVGQVLRGQTSHFNATTTLNNVIFEAMAVSIMSLFVAQLVIAVVVLRARIADRAAAAGVRLGLGLSLLGMAAAIPMVLPTAAPGIDGISGAHSVGTPDGGPGLPLVGWSTAGGDLRAGHFLGLHALQALPLLALLLIRYAPSLTDTTKVRLLRIAGAAYGAVTILLTWQALRGQPIVAPDALTLSVLAAIVLGAAAAAGSAVAKN
ncbi:hypothetical protein [Actinoplanes sp. RD1]|uniref:hypothetical protein n=1 Tax=Actinoplanes sp. RD1 TaxID=3064538 RepID=UPI002741DDD4|nr:hypothetical protein [Actinoplanes sp. RD1]